jgi:hypothetical protein
VSLRFRILMLFLGLVLTLAGIGWNYYHQRTLSPEVQAAVLATLGGNTSYLDASVYLRSAKLACRTKRDFDVVGRLDNAITLLKSGEEDSQKSWDLLMKGIAPPSSEENDCTLKLELDQRKIQTETRAEREYCQTVFERKVDESKSNRELQDSYDKAGKSELTEGRKLIVQLRAEMNLPALPEQKDSELHKP